MLNLFNRTFAIRRVATAAAVLLIASNALAQLNVAGGPKKFTWNDRVSKNQFVWVSEAPVENIRGTSEGITGSITFDPKDLRTMRGTISTATRTMKTGNGTRDSHLLSAEWMDAAKYPAITFNITGVSEIKTNAAGASGLASGDFTMHGVTKHLAIPFQMTYLAESAKTRERAPGDLIVVKANFNIALKDFNITGTSGLVGSKVGESIKIDAQLFGNSEAANTDTSTNP